MTETSLVDVREGQWCILSTRQLRNVTHPFIKSFQSLYVRAGRSKCTRFSGTEMMWYHLQETQNKND